jgi:hypothetical protein
MRTESDLNHLYAALLLSCLLHAMLLFASPWLMEKSAPTLASRDAENSLVARLVPLRSAEGTAPDPRLDDRKQAQAAPQNSKKESFFPEDKLTKLPHFKGEMILDIPEARQLTSSGSMVMRLWIDSLGRVTSIEIDETNLPPEYTSAVAATFSKIRFEPGEINGRPVGGILKFEVTHNIEATLAH